MHVMCIRACPAGPGCAAFDGLVLVLLFLLHFVPRQPPRHKSWLSACVCAVGCRARFLPLSHLAQTDRAWLGAQHTPAGEAPARRQRLPRLPTHPSFFPSLLPVDLRSDLQPAPQPDKIRYLSDSLRRITGELNGVLGLLDSLSTGQPPLVPSAPCSSVPLSTYVSLAGPQAGGSPLPPAGVPLPDPWARGSALGSAHALAARQSVDSMLAEKWHKYFPGTAPLLHPSARLPGTSDFPALQVPTIQCTQMYKLWTFAGPVFNLCFPDGFPWHSGSSKPLENKLGYVPAE